MTKITERQITPISFARSYILKNSSESQSTPGKNGNKIEFNINGSSKVKKYKLSVVTIAMIMISNLVTIIEFLNIHSEFFSFDNMS